MKSLHRLGLIISVLLIGFALAMFFANRQQVIARGLVEQSGLGSFGSWENPFSWWHSAHYGSRPTEFISKVSLPPRVELRRGCEALSVVSSITFAQIQFQREPLPLEFFESLFKANEIETLSLVSTTVEPVVLRSIVKESSVVELNLSNALLIDFPPSILSEMANLRTLYLDDTCVGDDVVEVLLSHPHLESLGVSGTRISKVGIERLKARFPECD